MPFPFFRYVLYISAKKRIRGYEDMSETSLAIPKFGYIRRVHLAQLLGIHVATLDRWIRQKQIPAPIKIGEKSTVFNAVEINMWLEERRNKVS